VTLAPLPPGFVRVRDLIPAPRTVRVVIGETVIVRPRRVSPVPLTPYRDAASLWAAVGHGEFPTPTRGPWGCGWPRQTIEAWRARRGLK
jgi:hypothetical protein